jgi:hypothetical protein
MGRSVLFLSHGFPTLKLVPMWDVGMRGNMGMCISFYGPWVPNPKFVPIWDVGNMWKYGNMGSHLGICVPMWEHNSQCVMECQAP